MPFGKPLLKIQKNTYLGIAKNHFRLSRTYSLGLVTSGGAFYLRHEHAIFN